MTFVRERRLEHVVLQNRRPVYLEPEREYIEIGIRSHGRGVFLKPPTIGADIGDKDVFEVCPGELVFNIVFAWEGAVALTGVEVAGCIASHRFPAFSAREGEADPRYLNYFFQTPRGRFLLDDNSPGAAGRNRTLNTRRLLKESIPLPPIKVQTELADHLEARIRAVDATLDANRSLLERALECSAALVTCTPRDGATGPQVPWTATLPTEWPVFRAGRIFREVHLAPADDDGVVTAFRDGQVTLRDLRRKDGYMVAVAEQGYQRVRIGDLVVHQMDGFAGAIGVAEATGKCSPEYIVLEPRHDGIKPEFFAECLRTMARNGYVQVICPSVRERAPRFLYSTFKDVELPVPPVEDQLDRVERIRFLREAISKLRLQQAQLAEFRGVVIASLVEAALRGVSALSHHHE